LDLLAHLFHHPEKLADRYLLLRSQPRHHRCHRLLLLLNHCLELEQGLVPCRFLHLESGPQCCHQLLFELQRHGFFNRFSLREQSSDLGQSFLSQGKTEFGYGLRALGQGQTHLLGCQFESVQRLSWQAVCSSLSDAEYHSEDKHHGCQCCGQSHRPLHWYPVLSRFCLLGSKSCRFGQETLSARQQLVGRWGRRIRQHGCLLGCLDQGSPLFLHRFSTSRPLEPLFELLGFFSAHLFTSPLDPTAF
jgi:hypothetical protein